LKNTKNTHEVQDLALDDEVMKPIHHLLDAGVPVPPVHVEDVDVCGAQFLKTGLHTNVHGFEVVSGIVHLLREGVLARFEVGGELRVGSVNRPRTFRGTKNLGRNHKLISDVTLLGPFTNKTLRGLVLAAHR
jgi:hypothetical protein